MLSFRLAITCNSVVNPLLLSPAHFFLVRFEPKEISIVWPYVTYVNGKYSVSAVQAVQKQCGIVVYNLHEFTKKSYLY